MMQRIVAIGCLLPALAGLTGSARAQDIPLSKVLAPGEGWKPLTRHEFPSIAGLATDGRGLVLVSDPGNKQIVRVDLAGKAETFARLTSEPAGLAFDQEGHLFACQPKAGRIVRIEAPDRETIAAEGLKGVRDLVVRRDGIIYCTVPDKQAIYRVNKLGDKCVASRSLAAPTGLGLWPGQGTLVAADSAGAWLVAFRIDKNCALTDGERYYPLRVRTLEKSAAGGLTVDAGGLVYATSKEGVQVFDPTGRLCGVLLRPSRDPHIAVTFAGPERDHLVLACGNKLFIRKLLLKGSK